jgi:two-component system response regulator FixJ
MTVPFEPKGGCVLVLDDEPGVGQAVSIILSSAGFEVICCAELGTLNSFLRERTPSCILLDQVLKDASGIEVLKELRREGCTVPVLMISGKADIATAVLALKHGASDFVEKPFRGADLIARVKAALSETASSSGARGRQAIALHFPGRAPLTVRERNVLAEIASGCSTKETARRLGLSPRTVESHRMSIMRKLGAKNLASLVRMVLSFQ